LNHIVAVELYHEVTTDLELTYLGEARTESFRLSVQMLALL